MTSTTGSPPGSAGCLRPCWGRGSSRRAGGGTARRRVKLVDEVVVRVAGDEVEFVFNKGGDPYAAIEGDRDRDPDPGGCGGDDDDDDERAAAAARRGELAAFEHVEGARVYDQPVCFQLTGKYYFSKYTPQPLFGPVVYKQVDLIHTARVSLTMHI